MKRTITLLLFTLSTVILGSCNSNIPGPVYTYDDPFEIYEIEDGVYNYGTVTMYSTDGDCDTFTVRTKDGARCVYYRGEYYNLEYDSWVYINGSKYKCAY